MLHQHRPFLAAIVTIWALCATRGVARADDVFYSVPVADLKITEGRLPAPATQQANTLEGVAYGRRHELIEPRVVIEGAGEALILSSSTAFDRWNLRENAVPPTVTVRVPAAREISGWLFMPKADRSGAERLRFTIPADASKPSAREDFYTAVLRECVDRLNHDVPGAAWFRYRADVAIEALGRGNPTTQRAAQFLNWQNNWQRSSGELDETFSLFSGGRAISENLQLDRTVRMRDGKRAELTEDVAAIRGIDTASIDWTADTRDMHPATDALADVIPVDQHVIFFPSFEAALNVSKLVDEHGTPVLDVAETRSETADSRRRYEQQMGLSLNALSKLLGPTLVDSVAITGSDPYYRVGTDIAVIFHSPNARALNDLLLAKITFQNLATNLDHAPREIAGLSYVPFVNGNRSVSSYIALSGDVVIVTNSLKQLENIAKVISKKSLALSDAPEYVYFRNRYPKGASEETAFVILTDAAMRRRCGPRWRIADSRRTRAAAALAQLQAQVIDKQPLGIDTDLDLGEVKQVGDQVVSSQYGSFQFMTPIAELDVDRCTTEEKDAYERWRNQYQSYWRWAFDPIAAKLTNSERVLSLDLSVRPLIAATDYRQFIDLCSGVTLSADSGDPHDAMLHFAMSINAKSSAAQGWTNLGAMFVGGKQGMLNWIGKSAAIYLDHDPIWKELGQKDQKSDEFDSRLLHLPIALRVESNDPLKLAAFLTSIRAWVEQSAPNLTAWTTQQHNDQSYVKIEASPNARREGDAQSNWAFYYAATADALLVTINEDLLKRALDRRSAEGPATAPTTRSVATARPWLGESVAFQCDRGVLDLIEVMARTGATSWQDEMQEKSWNNLLILNEWKRLFPEQDPLAVHQQLWGARPLDPAGGSYAWNEQWHTMESSTFGHPGQPKQGPRLPAVIDEFDFFNAGLTFESQGLRARAQLNRSTK